MCCRLCGVELMESHSTLVMNDLRRLADRWRDINTVRGPAPLVRLSLQRDDLAFVHKAALALEARHSGAGDISKSHA